MYLIVPRIASDTYLSDTRESEVEREREGQR